MKQQFTLGSIPKGVPGSNLHLLSLGIFFLYIKKLVQSKMVFLETLVSGAKMSKELVVFGAVFKFLILDRHLKISLNTLAAILCADIRVSPIDCF